MSRTILISAVLLTIASVPMADNRLSAQDLDKPTPEKPAVEEPARNDKEKEPAATDPFGGPISKAEVRDPFADVDPFGNGLPSDVDPFADEREPTAKPAEKKEPTPRRQPKPLRHGEEAILKVLEEPTNIEFLDMPFCDAIEYLKHWHRVVIHIDRAALDDVGLKPDEPVTINIEGIPLRSGLNLMLDEHHLTWTILNDVLVITTNERAEDCMVTKAYDVSDLVFPTTDRPYDGRQLPTVPPKEQPMPLIDGGKGGILGNGMRGGGMGMFNVNDDPGVSSGMPRAQQGPSSVRDFKCGLGRMRGTLNMSIGGMGWNLAPIMHNRVMNSDMEVLVATITSTIVPQTWDEVGGPGSITDMEQLLVITQTYENHAKIQNLLKMIRETKRAVPTVVMDARWVLHESKSADPMTLERLKDATPAARARIGCRSGQLVHLANGRRRTVTVGAIPIVGEGDAIGYHPEIAFPNVGIVLEVRPTVTHDRKSVMLDVRNIVTQWNDPDPPIQVEGDSAEVDRVKMPTQQLATSMRVPLGKPTLIGGITLAPTDAGPKKELYLVIETSIAKHR